MELKNIDVIIYHSPCHDGTSGAWVALKYMKEHFPENNPELFGTQPGRNEYNFPDINNKNVIIIDISFSKEIMIDLYNNAKSLICLDHHKSAKEQLMNLDFCVFDMKKSGVQLAWDYFYPNIDYPEFINYIAGRDLWDFSNPNTKPFSSGLFYNTSKLNETEIFKYFDELYENKNKINDLIEFGKIHLDIDNNIVGTLCKSAILCKMDNKYYVWVAETRLYRSEVGDILCSRDDCDFSLTYCYDLKQNAWWISLRSKNDKQDVSQVAQNYNNGGGHHNASGFGWFKHLNELLVSIN